MPAGTEHPRSSPDTGVDMGASIEKLIGRTPLLALPLLVPPDRRGRVAVYAKAEWFNPGGSVKDRAAWGMVRAALASGELTRDKILLDSTSGNTGIAYAMIGAALGLRVEICLPANAGLERKRLIAAYGAVIHYTDPLEGSEGARVVARRMWEERPDLYYLPDQYNNPANPQAHYETTGPEIVEQTRGRVTHFVAAIGTGGTVMGTSRYLKEWAQSQGRTVAAYAVEPADAVHGLEGMKHMASAVVPGIYDESRLDGKISVETEDAYAMAARLAREAGILVGPSGGAAAWAAAQLARQIEEGVIVTVFPDSGSRYAGDGVWDAIFSRGREGAKP